MKLNFLSSGPLFKRPVTLLVSFAFCIGCCLSLPSYAVAPQANGDTRGISSNSSITLNVLLNDTDADGDVISVQSVDIPVNGGTAVLNVDGSIFYTPATDFVGVDTFNYVLQDDSAEGLVSQATVTININDNLAEFSDNTNNSNVAGVLDRLCDNLGAAPGASLGSEQQLLLQRCNNFSVFTTEQLSQALTQIAPEETLSQMRIAASPSNAQTHTVNQRMQRFKTADQFSAMPSTFSFNGKPLAHQAVGDDDSEYRDSFWSRLGVFSSIQLETSERDKTDLENGYRSDARIFVFGMDYFINESALVGFSVSDGDNSAEYKNNDGGLDSDMQSVLLFGAYFKLDISVYLQAGLTRLDFESVRNLDYGSSNGRVQERLKGDTDGLQKILNTRIEREWRWDKLTLASFLRLDYLQSDIEGYTERGGSFAMALGKQSTRQFTAAFGIDTAYVLNQSWGVWVPKASLTYLSEVDSQRDAVTGRFAFDRDSQSAFTLNNDGGDSSFFQFSLGSTAIFKHGLSGFFEYTGTVGYDDLSVSQFQLGFRYEI